MGDPSAAAIGSITPTPTDEEAAAIIAAIEVGLPRGGVAEARTPAVVDRREKLAGTESESRGSPGQPPCPSPTLTRVGAHCYRTLRARQVETARLGPGKEAG